VLGVLRNTVRLMGSMAHLAPRMPRKKTLAILLTAGFELMEARDDGERARITHHAVEGAKALVSDREVAFVNAVLHRLPGALAAEVRADLPPTVHLAFTYSHPAELVERWVEEFGEAASAKLLRWNQEPAPMYVRMEPGVAPIDGLTPTKWPDFYEVGEVDRAALHKLFDAREAYAQDPSPATRWTCSTRSRARTCWTFAPPPAARRGSSSRAWAAAARWSASKATSDASPACAKTYPTGTRRPACACCTRRWAT
jgi:16S rRNA (cytosine967-C5)-methyltransferase